MGSSYFHIANMTLVSTNKASLDETTIIWPQKSQSQQKSPNVSEEAARHHMNSYMQQLNNLYQLITLSSTLGINRFTSPTKTCLSNNEQYMENMIIDQANW